MPLLPSHWWIWLEVDGFSWKIERPYKLPIINEISYGIWKLPVFFSKPGQLLFSTCQCCINWFCFDPNPLSSFRRRYSVVLGLAKIGVLDSRRPVANNVQSFDRISECANWVWDLGQMTTTQTDVVTISFECCLCMFMFLSLNFVLKPQNLHDWPPIFKVPFIWE